MSILTLAACSTTEHIPEGEQLYLGIKGIKYATPKGKTAHLHANGEAILGDPEAAETSETEPGVIVSIADAYDKVHSLIDGTSTTTADVHQLKSKKRSELTHEERQRLDLHEQAEASALATAKEEIEAALAYEPNAALFGSSSLTTPWKFGLWVYNHYSDSPTKFGRWMFRKFGEQPVLISTVAPQTRAKIATNTLRNYGYFRGDVGYRLVESRNPKAARVAYDVTTGPVFHLDSIEYRSFGSTVADSLISATSNKRLLKSGDAFNVVNLSDEQTRIERLMRENGYYYWAPSYTSYQADTLAVPGYVQLRVLPKAGIPSAALRPWVIGRTFVTIRDQQNSPLDHEQRSRRGSTTYLWSGEKMPANARIWRSAINHRHGRPFRQSDQEATVSKLAALGILSSLEVSYSPHSQRDSIGSKRNADDGQALVTARDSLPSSLLPLTSPDTLDVYVNVTMGKLYDSSFEVNATLKSSQQLGPGVRYELAKLNAFRGGETVAWDIYGSYEWQLGRRASVGNGLLNSFELGSSAKIEIPRFVFPFVSRRRLRFPSTTTFALRADWKNRSGFFQMLDFGADLTYSWTRGRWKHQWSFLDLDYYKLSHTTFEFDQIVVDNPAIYASMRNIFVPSMGFSTIFSSPVGTQRPFWLQWTVKEAGNLTDGIHLVLYPNHETDTPRRIFGSRFAQFVKTTAEVHYSLPISSRFTLATRAFGGIILNYGGNESAPYAEQFYIGGANSVRAFTVRTAGPGGYRTPESKYAYVDQTGDFKLEANAELRARLFGSLHGALFLDAGNVWLLKKDLYRPDAELSAHNLRRIALGTGVGLRYDLDFLILRFDVGLGLHAPYDTSRHSFYNFERFRDGVAYHFAIGYPF